MSNSDASIDPLLRNIASNPSSSLYHSASQGIPGSSTSFSRSLSYERTSPYLYSQHLHGNTGVNIENFRSDSNFNDPKRSRACEACRGLKVRCEPDPNSTDDTCKRCAKANRVCVVTAPSRKRRKKNDSRVAELEKKIDALTASLAAQRSGSISVTQRSDSEDINEPQPVPNQLRNNSFFQSPNENYGSSLKSRFDNHSGEWTSYTKAEFESRTSSTISSKPTMDQNVKHSEMHASQSKLSASPSSHSKVFSGPVRNWLDSTTKSSPVDEYVDVIDRGLLTFEVASKIFNDFIKKLIPRMPIVAFPPGTTSASVRKSTPALFLAILSAGSTVNYPHLQRILSDDLMKLFSQRILLCKYKSIELTQALLVASLWYWPVEKFEEVNFFQLRHTAAVIAIDIGMGRKKRSPVSRVTGKSRDNAWYQNPCPDPESIEPRRTWLACYLLCCSASILLRRPNLVHWNSFTADCVEVLENSDEAYPSDKLLCQWVKIHHLAEEIDSRFYTHDLGARVSFADSQVQHILRGLERDLEKWRACQKHDNTTSSLKISELGINLYMHEIATQIGHQVDEFQPPFTEDTMTAFVEENNPTPLSSLRVTALSTCLVSIDGILDTFLDLDIENILLMPAADYGWIAYALGVLLKLYFSAATPNSELGEVINKDNMKVEFYLDRLIEKLRPSSGDEVIRCSARFSNIVIMMRNWFRRQTRRHPKPSHQQAIPENQFDERSKEKITHTSPPISNKKHTNFSSGNTMLQLLSEVATGNTISQSNSSVSNNYSSSTDEWRQPSQATYPSYSTCQFPVNQMYGQEQSNGNIDPSLKMDMEYDNTNGSAFGSVDFGPFISDDLLFGGLMNSVFPSNMVFEGM